MSALHRQRGRAAKVSSWYRSWGAGVACGLRLKEGAFIQLGGEMDGQ